MRKSRLNRHKTKKICEANFLGSPVVLGWNQHKPSGLGDSIVNLIDTTSQGEKKEKKEKERREKQEMKLYNTKMIVSKTMTEYLICLDDVIACNYKAKTKYNRRKFEELSEEEQEESKARQESYYKRKIFDIERLIDCNYNDKSTFLTLTFSRNLEDLPEANKEFNLFIKRLKYYLKKIDEANEDDETDENTEDVKDDEAIENIKVDETDENTEDDEDEEKESLKYISIWERQQRGAIHYHVIMFNLPFIEAKKIEEIWKNGFIKINLIKDEDKATGSVSSYLTKYFVKDIAERVREKKAYFSSRNLKKPKEWKQRLTDDEINEILVNDKDILYQKAFDGKIFIGTVGKEKKFKNARKIYIKKRNKKISCKNNKNVLEFKNENNKKSYLKK